LPQTDRICLVRDGQSPGLPLVEGKNVGWEQAEALFGPFVPQEDYYPPIYQAPPFPSHDQFRRLQ
jgi:hypothetical protein